jgi:hypothetical protein
MAITKPPVLPAWADAGDKVQPSNAELSVGWPVSSTPPSRQRFNWVLNFVANAVRYFSRRGLPDYDAAETYMVGDRTIGDDGKTYRSLVDNNTAQTPSTSPTKWERWGFSQSDLGANAQAQPYTAFTTTGATGAFVLTPSPAIAAYAANQRFRVKFHAVGNGADTLNASGLGAKSLKQYNSAGSKVAAVIALNQLVDVEYDGVDFVLLDPLPVGLSTSGTVSYSSSTTLSISDIGKTVLLNFASTGGTVSLPSLASVAAGKVVILFNWGNHSVGIAAQAGQVINNNSGNGQSFLLPASSTLILASESGISWNVIGGSAQLTTSPLFGSSKVTNGYQKLPSGLIMQWGVGSTAADGLIAVTFPIAFPTACVGIYGTHSGAGLAAMIEVNTTRTTTGVTTRTFSHLGSTAAGWFVYWFAIGY